MFTYLQSRQTVISHPTIVPEMLIVRSIPREKEEKIAIKQHPASEIATSCFPFFLTTRKLWSFQINKVS